MNCETSKELMMKYFDAEMDEAEEIQFRKHLRLAECSDEYNCMEAIFATLDEGGNRASDDFEAGVMDK